MAKQMYRYEVIVQKAGHPTRSPNSSSIEVHAINGTYEFDGWLNGFPCFCRKGTKPAGSKFEYLIYQETPLLEPRSLFPKKQVKHKEAKKKDKCSRSSSPVPANSQDVGFFRLDEFKAESSPRHEIDPGVSDSSSVCGSPPPLPPDSIRYKDSSLPPFTRTRRWALCKVENEGFRPSSRQGRYGTRHWEDEKLIPIYCAPLSLGEESEKEKNLIPPETGWVPVDHSVRTTTTVPEFKCASQTTDIWDVGSEVEVFSTSQQTWKRAKIMEIVGDEFKVQSQQDTWKSTVRRGSGRIRPGQKQLVERSEWDVDTAVEVYSTSKQRWKDAIIIDTKPLRVEYTDGTGGKWMALGSDWLRVPGEPESPTDLLKSQGEGLSSHLMEVIKDIFWNFSDPENNIMKLEDIQEWLKCCTPRNSDKAVRDLAEKILKDNTNSVRGLSLQAFIKYYVDACHDRPKAVRHDLINLGYKRFARKGHSKTWENGTSVEAYSKTQHCWKQATIVHVIQSGGKLHIQYSDNTGRKWMARYSDRLRPKMTLDVIYRTRRFVEVVRAVSSSVLGKDMPITVIRDMVLMNFEQCNHCLYYDDTTKHCPGDNCQKTVCRTCNTDGLNFHNCS